MIHPITKLDGDKFSGMILGQVSWIKWRSETLSECTDTGYVPAFPTVIFLSVAIWIPFGNYYERGEILV